MRSKFKWIFTLLVALTVQFSFAQEKTVTGVVSDELGPIAGANIVVQGTSRGTTTDFDGNYTIKAKQGETLVFSYTGKKQATVSVGAANTYNVTLKDDVIQGEEVVIVGALGIKRKVDAVTSSYSLVKQEDLKQASNPNAVQALVGKVSGLQINVTSSGVNPDARVVFRGARSITGNNQALVVIDGAISTIAVFQQIPPEMIENVTALKGPQGAALYGSDGVNGVIVVNTKKGSANEKFRVSINSSVDISDIAYLPQRQLRYGQGWDGFHSNFENGSWGPEFDGTLQPVGLPQADGSYIMAPYSPIKDNYKDFFQKGTIFQNGINFSGGSLESGYLVFGANRVTNDFVVDGDELKRNSFLLKAGKQLGKWRIEGNFNYISERENTADSGLYDDLLQTASNIPVSQFSHGLNQHHWNIYYLSPYWRQRNQRATNSSNYFAGIADIGYQINKNINVSYLANIRLSDSHGESYHNGYEDTIYSIYGSRSNSELSNFFANTISDRRFYGDLKFSFDYDLTEDLDFNLIVGNNIQDRSYARNQVGGTNLEIPGLYNYSNVLNPSPASALNNLIQRNRKVGFFANLDLGYKDYLFLNATARQDYSSVFYDKTKGFFYPSVGISFIPTKAFENIKGDVLNYWKIVLNYTKVGNDTAIAPYAVNQLGSLGFGFPFANNSYVQQTQQTNQLIKPEFVTTKEVAMSLDFFKSRLVLDATYYISDTDDLITRIGGAAPSGVFSNLTNIGKMQTKGYEIDLGFTPIKSKDPRGFIWDAKLSYTHFKSIVKKVSDDATQVSLRQPYNFVGVFAEEGEEFPLIKGTSYSRDEFGRIMLDASGMPIVDNNFKKLGKATPDYILGLNTSVAYKGFRLAATMDYRTGHQFFSDVKRNLSWTGQLIESAENRGGFIMPNSSFDYNGDGVYSATEANTSVVTGGGSTANFINYYNNFYSTTGENLVIDATAFKVRELALSYSFDSKLIERTGLSNLTLGINARNPFTWLPKQNRGYNDPETSETTGNAAGLAFTDRYPVQRTFGFSVNATF